MACAGWSEVTLCDFSHFSSVSLQPVLCASHVGWKYWNVCARILDGWCHLPCAYVDACRAERANSSENVEKGPCVGCIALPRRDIRDTRCIWSWAIDSSRKLLPIPLWCQGTGLLWFGRSCDWKIASFLPSLASFVSSVDGSCTFLPLCIFWAPFFIATTFLTPKNRLIHNFCLVTPQTKN